MRHPQFPYLFSPLRVGSVTVPNRVVFSAHLTNLARGNRPGPDLAAYYEERARGGTGLIITEEQSVHPTDHPYERLIKAFDETVIPAYQDLTRRVHAHGTPVLAQINHNGGQASSLYTRLPVWAPSPIADPLFREVPKEMDAAEIAEVVAAYARVARHVRDGGFDGAELQASHSSLLRQFLSPYANRRTDAYGGTVERRARIVREIVAAIRAEVGREFVLGVRIPGDEFIDGGLTLEHSVQTVQILDRDGLLDYFNTSLGTATHTLFMVEGSMHLPPGYQLFTAAALREVTDLPVVGIGRVKDPHQAEQALADGVCDLVGMVRQQIAEPETARKAREGRVEEIRLCISCNQDCIGREGLNLEIGCIENPAAGHERELGRPPAAGRKRVLVVGGGPAGLECAAVAAARGCEVTLAEADDELGGQVRLAVHVPNRAELGDLVRNLAGELRRRRVEVRLGTRVTAEEVVAGRWDAVVCCTGSLPQPPAAGVLSVWDVMRGVPVGERVAVVDLVGFHQATATAEWLAQRGHLVEVLTPTLVAGQDLGLTLDLENWHRRALALGVRIFTSVAPLGYERSCIQAVEAYSGRMVEFGPFDTVVVANHGRPDDELYHALKGRVEVHRAGDCVAPRRAGNAINEAHRVALTL
ncbi:MAG TPA: mycofactocin system FadH/OYE family oxidoreductase 2 [Candidatus Dormibacteraeota bacterium]|nr:mycofactocin system FadH/OYE family oxidoreductase 2 [Candidatus Dormibacteraeota bacterium]